MGLDQGICAIGTANEAKHVHEPGLHDGPHRRAPCARHEIDHARRQHPPEDLRCQYVREAADGRELEDGAITHQQRGDQHRVHLIQRVVERREPEHHADRPAPYPHAHAAHLSPVFEALSEGRVGLERSDGGGHKVHRAIELLGSIPRVLGYLPHQHVDYLVAH